MRQSFGQPLQVLCLCVVLPALTLGGCTVSSIGPHHDPATTALWKTCARQVGTVEGVGNGTNTVVLSAGIAVDGSLHVLLVAGAHSSLRTYQVRSFREGSGRWTEFSRKNSDPFEGYFSSIPRYWSWSPNGFFYAASGELPLVSTDAKYSKASWVWESSKVQYLRSVMALHLETEHDGWVMWGPPPPSLREGEHPVRLEVFRRRSSVAVSEELKGANEENDRLSVSYDGRIVPLGQAECLAFARGGSVWKWQCLTRNLDCIAQFESRAAGTWGWEWAQRVGPAIVAGGPEGTVIVRQTKQWVAEQIPFWPQDTGGAVCRLNPKVLAKVYPFRATNNADPMAAGLSGTGILCFNAESLCQTRLELCGSRFSHDENVGDGFCALLSLAENRAIAVSTNGRLIEIESEAQ